MPENIPDKNIDVNGKLIGGNTVIKMTIKTAFWIIGIVVTIIFSILYHLIIVRKKIITLIIFLTGLSFLALGLTLDQMTSVAEYYEIMTFGVWD